MHLAGPLLARLSLGNDLVRVMPCTRASGTRSSIADS
jgi:hypothetical protein